MSFIVPNAEKKKKRKPTHLANMSYYHYILIYHYSQYWITIT